ncbi:MAG: type I secretion protein TolC [Methylophaga sp.]|nr:MAG: type I secretion protein TolC [Methylophaga sp.]
MKLKMRGIVGGLVFMLPLFLHAETLVEAVEEVINSNPNVLASINERQAAAEEIKQAQAGYLPTLDLAIGTGWEMTDSPATRGEVHFNRDEASLQLRQMIFDGMETKNEVRRLTARTDSRAYNIMGTSEDKALEAIEAYLNVLRRQHLVDLAITNLEAHDRTHDQINLRSEYGVGRKADEDQSSGRLALAKANLIAEQSNQIDAETIYLRVVGIVAEDLTDPDSPRSLIPETLDEAIALALEGHPTLKSAMADVESSNAQYDTAKSPFFPRVDFELGTTTNNDIDGVNGTNKDITAMFRLRYNLLNGGRDSARREETAYLINQATEIRNNTHRQVEQSMRLSWNALKTVDMQREYFEIHVKASKRSRDAYQQQFNLGQRTLLDLLDSENEVFVASQDYVNSQYDEYIALYRILNSMGVLLPSLNVELPEASAIVSK